MRPRDVIAAKSPLAIRLGKKLVHEQVGMTLSDAYACASRTIVENMLAADAEAGSARSWANAVREQSAIPDPPLAKRTVSQ